MTAMNRPFERVRIPAQAIAFSDSLDARLDAVVARERALDKREFELVAQAREAGLRQAFEDARGEISEQAACFAVRTVELTRVVMHSVLVATRAALQTILADESAVKVTESRVRKLIIDIADRNVKLYCSSTDFNRMEEVLQSLRGEDDIAIALNVDEALHANDLVIESEFGVIHATIS
ncbi:MAG: hypothetical protein ACRDAM_03560, partial [Casimicrobium sp.]